MIICRFLSIFEILGYHEDYVDNNSIKDLFNILSSYWILIPICLCVIALSSLFLRNRSTLFIVKENNSLNNQKTKDKWYFSNVNDEWYTKVILIIDWILAIVTGLICGITVISILFRIAVGYISAIFLWLLLWICSILIFIVPALIISILAGAIIEHCCNADKTRMAIMVILFCAAIICEIVFFWDDIIDWSWTFQRFPSIDIMDF